VECDTGSESSLGQAHTFSGDLLREPHSPARSTASLVRYVVEGGSMAHTMPRNATHPTTRAQNNIRKPKIFGDDFVCLLTMIGEPRDYIEICKPKLFGDDFVCLLTMTGEPRDYIEASMQKEWRNGMDEEY
jgi:hypothetical protein